MNVFDWLGRTLKSKDIDAIDALLQPFVKIVVQMPAPISTNPMIVAIK